MIGRLLLQQIGRRRRVPRLDQRRHRLLEPREIAVVRRGKQAVKREVLLLVEHAHGMQSARGLGSIVDVARIVRLFRTARAGRGPRPVVRVVEPAARGIVQSRRLVDREDAVPFRGGIAAVDRSRPVQLRIALRDEVGVEVRDRAIGVGIDGVVRRVGVQLHHVAVRLVVPGLRA